MPRQISSSCYYDAFAYLVELNYGSGPVYIGHFPTEQQAETYRNCAVHTVQCLQEHWANNRKARVKRRNGES